MPFGSSSLSSALPIGPSVTLRSAALSGSMYGRSNTSNSLTPIGPNLAVRRRQHLHRAELQRLELFLVLVERRVRIDLDLDLAVGVFLGQFLELLGALALRRVRRHDVAELDDGLRLRERRHRQCQREGSARIQLRVLFMAFHSVFRIIAASLAQEAPFAIAYNRLAPDQRRFAARWHVDSDSRTLLATAELPQWAVAPGHREIPRSRRTMQTSIATVSLSGGLAEKLEAIAAAGFTGVEIFESDLLSFNGTPKDVARMVASLGLKIVTFQPFRDFEGMPEPQRSRTFARAERKFDLMGELGCDLLMICSNVAPGFARRRRPRRGRLPRARRARAEARHPRRLRGAGLGPAHQRLPRFLGGGAPRRPSGRSA